MKPGEHGPLEKPGNSFEVVQLAKMRFSHLIVNHELFNGMGVGVDDKNPENPFFIRIYVKREPNEQDLETLPSEFEGIPVIYKVSEIIESQPAVFVPR